MQGFLVQEATCQLDELLDHYDEIARLSKKERRAAASDHRLIADQIDVIAPISINAGMEEVFERFHREKERTFFPVVDANHEPLGIVREQELKTYVFSRYGQALIANKTLGRRLRDFLVRCPTADINTRAELILHGYSAEETSEGILLTDSTKYAGFLSARSLLKIINDKDLTAAREQNPLSKLPGNNAIHEYISNVLVDNATEVVLVYFDFDNFKPFNDSYGFRLGDRAIVLFAELMAKTLSSTNCFAGHIGGDDFFAGFLDTPLDRVISETGALIKRFEQDVKSFYDSETRQRGWMTGHDRTGRRRRFPLLGVSAAVLRMPRQRSLCGIDEVSRNIADLKKQAKGSADHMAVARWPT